MAKILAHCQDEPNPVESLRQDLPPPVADIVRKMMAKKPDERYQRPADVAKALAPFCHA